MMWPDPADTQELLGDARAGKAGAVEQLLARHREPIKRAIRLRLDPAIAARVDASDIVQEVLLEASQRLPEYVQNPALPFHVWLRQIAKDHLVDAHRRHRHAQKRSVDRERSLAPPLEDASSFQCLADLIDRELTPASHAMREEMQRRFAEALATMDEDDREMILMRHFEQLSNQDVAEALGTSAAAASMRYLRALRRLRGLLAPGPTDSSPAD